MEKEEVNIIPLFNTKIEEPGYVKAYLLWNMQHFGSCTHSTPIHYRTGNNCTVTYKATTCLLHLLPTGSSSVKAVPKLAPTPKSEGPRRSLNLADYKKRRGLI